VDWAILATIIGCFLAGTSITIGLFVYVASKIDSIRSDINSEMKDFHGRLCAIEAARKS